MSLTRHPDPAIAAWLADGPTELSSTTRRSIGETIRTTRQRGSGVTWLPGAQSRLLAVVAVVAAVILTIAVAAGAARLVRPQPTPPPVPAILPAPTEFGPVDAVCWDVESTVALPAQGTMTLPGGAVALDYSLPAPLELDGGVADSVVGFGTPFPFPYHLEGAGPPEKYVPGSHGVTVVDVTRAVRHGSLQGQPRLGTDAETFLRDLDVALPYQNTVIDFEVDDVALTELAGMPAWSARVSVPDLDPPMWSHIDNVEGAGRGCAVEFGVANRVWVMDVGSSIVLVQAWAADDAALEAWLPDATQLVDTFRFRSEAS